MAGRSSWTSAARSAPAAAATGPVSTRSTSPGSTILGGGRAPPFRPSPQKRIGQSPRSKRTTSRGHCPRALPRILGEVEAAVDVDQLAGDPAGLLGRQEDGDLRDLL